MGADSRPTWTEADYAGGWPKPFSGRAADWQSGARRDWPIRVPTRRMTPASTDVTAN